MKYLLVFLTMAACINAQNAGRVTPQDSSRRNTTIQVASPSGATPITVRLMELNIKSTRGRDWEGTICMFFDANTGLYFWLHTMWPPRSGHPKSPDVEFFLQEGKVFLHSNKIVFFDYPRFLQSTDRASSLDDAERKSIIAATGKLQEGEAAMISASRRPFDTGLSRDFDTPPYSSMSIRPRIIDAQYKNSQWLLTIQGVWKEIVTLDDQFRLVGLAPAPGETPKYWRTKAIKTLRNEHCPGPNQ